MRAHYQVQLVFIIFVLSIVAVAGTTFKANTTLTAETSSNTSAAGTFTAQTNGNIGAANVSKVPLRTLLYPGSTAKIYANFLPWFGFGDHMVVGYTSNNTLQVQKQVNDMTSRSLDGAVIDWYGQGAFNTHFVSYDQAAQALMHESELHPGFNFALMHDAVALKACSATLGCDVTQTLINDLTYGYTVYENSPAYLRYNNQPVVYFFGHESYAIDWNRVRLSVPGNPMFIFRNPNGFNYAQSNGGFSWIAPETVSATDPMAILYLDYFNKTAVSLMPAYSTESAYKGFNDTLAAWSANRVVGQQCGQTWLQTMSESGKYYSSLRQMPGIQIVTWNDYEEGTEIETGIENCVTVSASVAGTAASWSITGQANTIDHYSVFLSQDGENLMWLADAPPSASSLDLAQFSLNAGSYTLFVKAVGRPSMTNKMSAGVPLSITNQPPVVALSVTPASGTTPATVTASTVGSSDPDGTIAATVINFGDGSGSVSGVSAAHVYNAPGSYIVSATVTDNLGSSTSKSTTVVVTGNHPPVAVLNVTPASGTAPVTVTASTAGSSDPDGTIATTVINFGDGSPSVSAASAAHMYAVPGTYTVTATVTDNLGAGSAATSVVVVTSANKPPVAVLSLSSRAGYGPLTITASTTGSYDPDGSIVSSSINFGDGTSAGGTSASHTYSVAGVYAVTATVTDNAGASSTTASTVTVNAPAVIVSSPGNSITTTSPVSVVASGFSGYPVTAMQIYSDGVLAYTANSASLNTAVALASGPHSLIIKGWDSAGRNFIQSLNLNITTVNMPPVAALGISATSVLVGGSINSSTAGSTDADGTIASTSIDFGDGTVMSGPAASHQYKAAGSYVVKATVTDNLGASSVASATVKVQPQFVAITSPSDQSTLSTNSVRVLAQANSGYAITGTQVYIDGSLKYKTSGASVDTTQSINTGTHVIVVQGWDASGATFKSQVSITR